MTAIRAEAIKNVRAGLAPDGLLPHKLLNLGQTHRIDQWVIAAILAFIKRKEPMGPKDAEVIGVENAFKIASLRECCTPVLSLDPRKTFRVAEERPKFAGGIADTKRIEQLFGLASSGN